MVGGIVSNNASGMCCGTAQNSYQTISSVKLLLADGTELDTGSEESKEAFRQSHPELLKALADLGAMLAAMRPWRLEFAKNLPSRTPQVTASTPWWILKTPSISSTTS